jgi:hypothetical protein
MAERGLHGKTLGNLSIALENGKRGAQLVSFYKHEGNQWKHMLRELEGEQSEGEPNQVHDLN